MSTRDGTLLADVTAEELRRRLAAKPEDGRAVMRLVAAREYKAGLTPPEIDAKYGWPEGTVYHWLEYFDERGVAGALVDRERSGRPSKLDDCDREQFAADLRESPEAFGYDVGTWNPELARRHLETEYDVEYSRRHASRLLAELTPS